MKIIIYLSMLCVVFSAAAVSISSNGKGQVLIFPYYTVNGGYNSLINIVNTTDQAKALKVRFREAANGREVMSYNLYLGAHDAWVASLSKGNKDQEFFTQINVPDASCTVPEIGSVSFYKGHYTGEFSDAYGEQTQRMHEGFVEIIEMGVLTGESAAATAINQANNTTNCQRLNRAWTLQSGNQYWVDDPTTDMLRPSGGLMGNLILINVADGLSVSENATALNDFSIGILHGQPGSDFPSLTDADPRVQIIHNNELEIIETDRGIDAVSYAITQNSIQSEFALDASINAKTNWVINLPTRQYYTDPIYSQQEAPIEPFTDKCEVFIIKGLFDREERAVFDPSEPIVVGSPVPPPQVEQALCHATNSINLIKEANNPKQGIFSSNFPSSTFFADESSDTDVVTQFENGWMRLDFFQSSTTENEGVFTVLHGLPVLGFSVQKYINSNAQPELLAQYAGLFNQKSSRSLSRYTSEGMAPEGNIVEGMSVAKQGVGQVLLYPYYSVRNNLISLISLVNTTENVKALKVRLREGNNARDALGFNLYLGAYDVWTAAVVAKDSTLKGFEGQNSAVILTNDTSCTVPTIDAQELLPYAFTAPFEDGLGVDMARVQEGSIEVFEMGTLINQDAAFASHFNELPKNCNALNAHWLPPNGQWFMDPTVNLEQPDGLGGLYGSLSLIDVVNGYDLNYDATAIKGFTSLVDHTSPGDLTPNLSTGDTSTTLIESQGGYLQTRWDSPINAVSALFMQARIENDFAIDAAINAETEWVNTYVTKQFYVDPLFYNLKIESPFNALLVDAVGACESMRFLAYNRDQALDSDSRVFPLLPPGYYTPRHCWSVNVADVDDRSEDDNTLFDSQLKMYDWLIDGDTNPIYTLNSENGWMQMQLDTISEHITGEGQTGETHEIYGKPVLGFVAQKYINSQAQPGLLANYGLINPNKGTRKIAIIHSKIK